MKAYKQNYGLTPEAQSDLNSIADYTYNTWGQEALENYLEGFDDAFQSIKFSKIVKRPFSEEYGNLYSLKSGRHYIFYIDEGTANPPMIIAILHEKMDIANRLDQRMEKFRKLMN